MDTGLDDIRGQAYTAASELVKAAGLTAGDILVVGCSSSEIGGGRIGTDSSPDIALAVYEGICSALDGTGIWLAAQCCEHLNRAIILEWEAAHTSRIPIVNVVPQPKAGSSFATAAYTHFRHPCAVEAVRAQAGMDIGGTLIGMHLQEVAVPVRLSLRQIGEATLICARTRPKFIGGERAHYDPALL